MKKAAWITFFYGLLILIGGIIGHIQAQSTTSLIVGIVFGILLLLTAMGMFRDHLLPCYLGILLILLLDAFFTYRWLLTLKFFPSGLLCVISFVTLILVVIFVRKYLRKSTK